MARTVFDVVDSDTDEVVTSTLDRDSAEKELFRLDDNRIVSMPGPQADEGELQPFQRGEIFDDTPEPRDVGQSNIT